MSVYSDFVDNVRLWANRDADVLPDSVIQDAMNFAMDKAYKKLKIPVLETTMTYTIVSPTAMIAASTEVKLNSDGTLDLPIPEDIISFIHLRIKESNDKGRTGVVFNEKTDKELFMTCMLIDTQISFGLDKDLQLSYLVQ